MIKLTPSDIATFINELEKEVPLKYLSAKNKNSHIKIVDVGLPDGPIRFVRWNSKKGEISENKESELISQEMIKKMANALIPNHPISVENLFGGGGNTRSVLEAILAHTPPFYTTSIDGHKHLIWMPEVPHKKGVIVPFDTIPTTAVRNGLNKIKVKNFGPVKEGCLLDDGFIDIKKVTIFIGNQGSGKSTIAKVISTLLWIEKAINRGDFSESMSNEYFKNLFNYQNLKSYFRDNTVIEFRGDMYNIEYDVQKDPQKPYPKISKNLFDKYIVPKIMYVPAERNLLSVIKNVTGLRGMPEPLFEFAEELQRGQNEFEGSVIDLPINGVQYKYDKETDASLIIGEDYNVNLLAASSGFQSIVPLFLVSLSLSNIIHNGSEINPDNISVKQLIRMNQEIGKIMTDSKTTDGDKIKLSNLVKAKFQNKAFINIVEEPEQNLFPISQQKILNQLLNFNNMNNGNKLIMTTHSPYMISYITIAIEGYSLKQKMDEKNVAKPSSPHKKISYSSYEEQLNEIVPIKSLVEGSDVVVYQFDDKGYINKLESYKGLPSDENKLNDELGQGNELFAKILEIEQHL